MQWGYWMHVSIKMRSFCHFLVAFLNYLYINNFLMIWQVLFFDLPFLLFTFLILSIFKIILRGFGTQSKKEFTAAFRECFSRLGELRSLAPQRPLTPMLALTATATLKTQQSVERSLCLRKDYVKIYLSPNRSNIYFTFTLSTSMHGLLRSGCNLRLYMLPVRWG